MQYIVVVFFFVYDIQITLQAERQYVNESHWKRKEKNNERKSGRGQAV